MTFKLNDKVYDPVFGYGTVTKIYQYGKYPVEVTFDAVSAVNNKQVYTLEGCFFKHDKPVLIKYRG